MFGKSRLCVILVATIVTFLDSSNAQNHQQFVALASKHTGFLLDKVLYSTKPDNFETYTGKHITCADVPDDVLASACCAMLQACDEVIPPKSTRYGIENPTDENLYGCACSLEFRDCLQKADSKNPSPVYKEIGLTYFDSEPRKCLLKLYIPFCNGRFYDYDGNPHDENPKEYYFCPKELYTKKYYEPLLAR